MYRYYFSQTNMVSEAHFKHDRESLTFQPQSAVHSLAATRVQCTSLYSPKKTVFCPQAFGENHFELLKTRMTFT